MEKAVLARIRQVNVTDVLDCNPRDVEVVRDKVVAKMCDEDRNFARYYMSLIIKDMRHLSTCRGLAPPTDEELEKENELEEEIFKHTKYMALEGTLFQLFKKLCSFLEQDKQGLAHSVQMLLNLKNGTKHCMDEIIDVLVAGNASDFQRRKHNHYHAGGDGPEGSIMRPLLKQCKHAYDRGDSEGLEDQLMSEMRVKGYMAHSKIEEILAHTTDSLSQEQAVYLKKELNKVRINEMRLLLKVKKLESEVAILKTHSEEFEGKLQTIEEELKQEMQVPEILKKITENVFGKLRKLSELMGPGLLMPIVGSGEGSSQSRMPRSTVPNPTQSSSLKFFDPNKKSSGAPMKRTEDLYAKVTFILDDIFEFER